MTLTIPDPVAVRDVILDDGAVIRLRRHGNTGAPRIVLSHGNGCAIDGYFPYWDLLRPQFDIVVFDFRNCGQNAVHEGEHSYRRFLMDMTAIYSAIEDAFGPARQVGAFHSMSARTGLKHMLDGNCPLDGLILFDPPMIPSPDHALFEQLNAEERVLQRWSQTRPDAFNDPGELAAQYAKSRMLSGWVDGAYELMARSVLRHDRETRLWNLVCSGPREAGIYRENAAMDIWPDAADFPIPVLTIASDPDSGIPSAPGYACRALRDECGWEYECVPGTGHFLQIQEPAACAEITRKFMARIGLG